MKIEYDIYKNSANIKNHNVSFEEVSKFDFSTAVVAEDTRFDYGEQRFNAIGFLYNRLYVLTFCYENDAIRAISFRKATNHEVKYYEKYIG